MKHMKLHAHHAQYDNTDECAYARLIGKGSTKGHIVQAFQLTKAMKRQTAVMSIFPLRSQTARQNVQILHVKKNCTNIAAGQVVQLIVYFGRIRPTEAVEQRLSVYQENH
jgi:hypothetical protein